MSSNRVGYLRLTYNDLKSILDLPEEVEIVGVHSGAFVHEFRAIHITISSPQFRDFPDGARIPQVSWEYLEQCRNSQETTSSQVGE